jgi:ActR/RegA family two-component response regulator
MAGSGLEWVTALDTRSTSAVAIRTRIITCTGIATWGAAVEGTVRGAAGTRSIAPDVDFSTKIV